MAMQRGLQKGTGDGTDGSPGVAGGTFRRCPVDVGVRGAPSVGMQAFLLTEEQRGDTVRMTQHQM